MNIKYMMKSEDTEQMRVISWAEHLKAEYQELELLYHCPNGGKRNKVEAIKFKQMGVKAGIPDLCLPVPAVKYTGLYIELKGEKGVISEKQKQMLRALADMNHYCCVCYGAEETIKVLKEYLLLRHMNTEMQADNLSIRIAGKLKQIFT